MKWSLLILTQPSRERFLARLMAVLKPQIEGHDDIEIVTRMFDRDLDLGSNRQAMIEEAQGTYVCSIDDDDLVPAHYVSKIYPLLDGTDYIGFRVQLFMDGRKEKPTFHSLRYPQWNGDDKGWYRDLSHLNPIRRELALLVKMKGGPGEDQRWADALRATKLVKTEHYIDEVMYLYYFRSNKESPPSEPRGRGRSADYTTPIQQVKCPSCRSASCGLAGGMRNCNQCGHRW